ncbi:ribose transport system ATP-binding protein [Streptomyces sp. SAI-135]|uniref:sugar ABC transporter ATP-binding protein n=1 Tax=unclassified Streptomyces TaxID=2593676 RepID=UPI002472FC94|nr:MULTISPECIES: sugar ABC transporter ATP-binding protein [unclassified Streptomyces]MDH6523155.1 ribose transport system ATP-binding protein [Streptomyces sp. SAI-090]MDH6574040.1 ribose transport system ATP-binding protein [Streptomyces sp. SAI-117]MDH6581224.1 ribose transport system ATP-binding protein [Streptomyces sp. SAI-133]MDH6613231.1 ribose transport system ATP-binding protein [Streptomyces sp. SAI-135]
MNDTALAIRHLTKSFGATLALDDVSFEVRAGHIHGLLGGNGSGKSTLIKILAGVHTADPGGEVHIGARTMPAHTTTPELARRCGLRFVHQSTSTFPGLTLAENIAIGDRFPVSAGRIRWSRLRRRTQALLDRFEIDARPDDRLGDLRPADQTMVAIARALQDDGHGDGPSVLVLDEPTASLPEHEVGVLLDALRRYARAGQTILYVSHRIDEVLDLTDAMTVLRDGGHVLTRTTDGMTEKQMIEHIVGRPVERVFAEDATDAAVVGDVVLEVEDLTGGPLRGIDLTVRAGEIVGIAGLLGTGRTELLRMIFGDHPVESGTIRLGGDTVRPRNPGEAMKLGIAHVPEEREHEAAFLDLSVRENLSAAEITKYWVRGRLDRRHERRDADRAITDFAIRTSGQDAPMASLSGGNQQKVVLARWLRRNPRLLLLDEPTQGVDVGARADVYAAIRASVGDGMAALVVSSDFDELAHACDRVLVLRDGRITAEVRGSDLQRHRLTELVFTKEMTP